MAAGLQYLPVPLCGVLFSILSASLLNNKFRLVIGRERYPVGRMVLPLSRGAGWEATCPFLVPWHAVGPLSVFVFSHICSYSHKDTTACLLEIKYMKSVSKHRYSLSLSWKRRENGHDVTLDGKESKENLKIVIMEQITKTYINIHIQEKKNWKRNVLRCFQSLGSKIMIF